MNFKPPVGYFCEHGHGSRTHLVWVWKGNFKEPKLASRGWCKSCTLFAEISFVTHLAKKIVTLKRRLKALEK